MKNLNEYEEEIYKCSRCGLCQSVCPVYKAALNECAVSRGKFNILNGIIKGELSMTQKVKSYLDLCTGCNACKDFCPSKIDAGEIFIAAKSHYYKTNKLTLKEKIINSYQLFKTALLCANVFFTLYRIFKLDKVVNYFEKLILKTGITGKRLILLNSLAECIYNEKTKSNTPIKGYKKAIYFEGCFNQYINSQTKNAVLTILDNSEIELIKKEFECCGISYLNDGNTDKFCELVKKNLKKIDCEFDYILTDCASCNAVLKDYKNYSDSEIANEVSEKTISVVELLKEIKFEIASNMNIAFHKPCHDDYAFIEIIKNIKGITFIETIDFDKCCGFSGKFAMQNQEISREISRKKAQQYIDSNADIILTTCPACVLGLNQGLAEIQCDSKPKVMNLFVFLALYCKCI